MIWSDTPSASGYAARKTTGLFFFGIFFFGFAVFWVNGAYQKSGPFALFGVPFIIVGLGMVLSPLWQFVRGRQTTYVLTDRRAVIDIAGFFPKRLSVPLNQVQFVELKASESGTGDVLFREAAVPDGNGYSTARDGFIAVPNAAEVDRLLRTAVGKARNAGAASV